MALSACAPQIGEYSPSDNRVITGLTMGTQFRFETNCVEPPHEQLIQDELERLTAIFSTYVEDSEVSRVNDSDSDWWVDVSEDFLEVGTHAERIFVASYGAFDPTVGPLVDRWGFGPNDTSTTQIDDEFRALRDQVGYQYVEFREVPPGLRKKHDKVRIDFSGIAKGFAVDQLAELTLMAGCNNYLVDIGGDVRVDGLSEKRKPWRVGIENPNKPGQVVGYIEPGSAAVATSGSYLQQRVVGEQSINHLIDPSTGLPINHNVIAVSVLADNAMSADGWATALAVSGFESSKELIERWRLNALLIEQRSSSKIELHRFGSFATDFSEL